MHENKIGYFALLRNIRNLIEQAPECIEYALKKLLDETEIKKSLVLPFRYLSAYDAIQGMNKGDGKLIRAVIETLNVAVDISLNNIPKFDGDTLVVLDVSGSMQEPGPKSPHIIGALFSAVLIKSNNADFIQFADNAKYVHSNRLDSTITLAGSLRFANGGTNFHSIFQTANKKYDRIIILSDMQGWIGGGNPSASFNEYKKRTGADPYIYSFDLKSYGTMMFPERNVFCLAGFSEKVFDLMAYMEKDKKVLFNEINKIEL